MMERAPSVKRASAEGALPVSDQPIVPASSKNTLPGMVPPNGAQKVLPQPTTPDAGAALQKSQMPPPKTASEDLMTFHSRPFIQDLVELAKDQANEQLDLAKEAAAQTGQDSAAEKVASDDSISTEEAEKLASALAYILPQLEEKEAGATDSLGSVATRVGDGLVRGATHAGDFAAKHLPVGGKMSAGVAKGVNAIQGMNSKHLGAAALGLGGAAAAGAGGLAAHKMLSNEKKAGLSDLKKSVTQLGKKGKDAVTGAARRGGELVTGSGAKKIEGNIAKTRGALKQFEDANITDGLAGPLKKLLGSQNAAHAAEKSKVLKTRLGLGAAGAAAAGAGAVAAMRKKEAAVIEKIKGALGKAKQKGHDVAERLVDGEHAQSFGQAARQLARSGLKHEAEGARGVSRGMANVHHSGLKKGLAVAATGTAAGAVGGYMAGKKEAAAVLDKLRSVASKSKDKVQSVASRAKDHVADFAHDASGKSLSKAKDALGKAESASEKTRTSRMVDMAQSRQDQARKKLKVTGAGLLAASGAGAGGLAAHKMHEKKAETFEGEGKAPNYSSASPSNPMSISGAEDKGPTPEGKSESISSNEKAINFSNRTTMPERRAELSKFFKNPMADRHDVPQFQHKTAAARELLASLAQEGK